MPDFVGIRLAPQDTRGRVLHSVCSVLQLPSCQVGHAWATFSAGQISGSARVKLCTHSVYYVSSIAARWINCGLTNPMLCDTSAVFNIHDTRYVLGQLMSHSIESSQAQKQYSEIANFIYRCSISEYHRHHPVTKLDHNLVRFDLRLQVKQSSFKKTSELQCSYWVVSQNLFCKYVAFHQVNVLNPLVPIYPFRNIIKFRNFFFMSVEKIVSLSFSLSLSYFATPECV